MSFQQELMIFFSTGNFTEEERKQLDWIRKNVDDRNLSEEMILQLIKDNPKIFLILENEERTKSIIERAINLDKSLVYYVPPNSIDNDLHSKIFQEDPNYFQYLPSELKTKDVCLKAVQFNADNLKFVPDDKKTSEVLKASFEAMRSKK